MKRIAIFVEGETELEFVSKFLKEAAGQNRISIDSYKCFGGGRGGRNRWDQLLASSTVTDEKYHALIYVSGSDSQVNSDIRRKLPSLRIRGFDQILGLKDLRGEQYGRTMGLADLPNMELGSNVVERECLPLSAHIVIAVMEIETWFLAETNHYECVDAGLTKSVVLSSVSTLGFDPYTDDLTLRPEPAEDLRKLYQVVGKSYKKNRKHRTRTIECLDYADIRINLKNRIVKLGELVTEIDNFLT